MTTEPARAPGRECPRATDTLRAKSGRAAFLILLGTGAASLGVALAALTAPEGGLGAHLTTRFFVEQDRAPLLLIAALLLAFAFLGAPAWRWPGLASLAGAARILPAALSAGAIAFSGWGTFQLFRRFNLSRDEIMADFDATILASGRLLAEVPQAWQAFRHALNPLFVLPVAEPFWVSSYLPGNAALRAFISLLVEPGWTNPLLLGIAILSLASVARRLWPERTGAQLVALVLLVASPQALAAAMTSYAMTPHLACNLLWLALFLRGDLRGHAGAILVGFLATGLHQTVFHPLFVAPFVLGLWWEGRRTLALRYILAYLLIFAFWTLYWKLVLASNGLSGEGRTDLGVTFFIVRVWVMLIDFSASGFDMMLKNLLRFVAWQHVAALPLLLLSWGAIRRGDGIARQLGAGLVLTLAAMFVLLAYQGHGWGYRYIHGLLGSVALLAGYGWIAATSGAPAERGPARTGFALGTLATLLVILPWQLHHAVTFMSPYRAAMEEIRGKRSDIVLVDWRGMQFAGDLVRNDPFLRNAPKTLDYALLSPAQIGELCRSHVVASFDRSDGERLGIAAQPVDHPVPAGAMPPVREMLKGQNCRTAPRQPALPSRSPASRAS